MKKIEIGKEIERMDFNGMDFDFWLEIQNLLYHEKYTEVINLIEQEYEDDDIPAPMIIYLAHAYSCTNNNITALALLDEIADEVEEDDLDYHFELAHCYYSSHRYRTALNAVRKCLEIDDTFLDAWILMCYIALEREDEPLFLEASEKAKEIDAKAWEECFGEHSPEPVYMYEREESACLLDHIVKYFGTISQVTKPKTDYPANTINVLYLPANDTKEYATLVTVGTGAYRANVPPEINQPGMDRIELVAYLPPDWDINKDDIRYSWIVDYLATLGYMIQSEDTWFAKGHTISNGSSFAPNTRLNGAIIDDLHFVDPKARQCQLPNGELVTFYQFIPIYEEEMVYKINHDDEHLFQRLYEKLGNSYQKAIDIYRLSACSTTQEKKWAIPKSSIEPILEWSGADGCFATDKILVEHRRIGFMYRETPENNTDSGWRFMAGDETEEYMNDTNNMGIYNLNTLCNYDIDIIDYLDSPVGTAFFRDKNGEFIKCKL